MMSPSRTLVLVASLQVCVGAEGLCYALGLIFNFMPLLFCKNRFSAEFPLDYTGQHPQDPPHLAQAGKSFWRLCILHIELLCMYGSAVLVHPAHKPCGIFTCLF